MNCRVFKQPKPNQSSFRITKELVDSLYTKARTVRKKGELVITLPCDDKHNYVLTCKITKIKK
jgi:hypothetical protein